MNKIFTHPAFFSRFLHNYIKLMLIPTYYAIKYKYMNLNKIMINRFKQQIMKEYDSDGKGIHETCMFEPNANKRMDV